jgi:hypothetical protein
MTRIYFKHSRCPEKVIVAGPATEELEEIKVILQSISRVTGSQ